MSSRLIKVSEQKGREQTDFFWPLGVGGNKW